MKSNKTNSLMGRVKKIHFIGIGGVGMCGIAEVLLHEGFTITGSDINESAVVQRLRDLGATIYIGHAPETISQVDVVVKSTAIQTNDPELVAAMDANIPVIPRAEMLAELMRFRYGIAIAGTHGKTTTTSLVASILTEGGLDPTFIIGGKLNSVGSNAYLGQSAYLVAEADESDASFLCLQPMMSVVTNIDEDHMATYNNDFSRLKDTFIEFIHHLPFYGLAILCHDDSVVRELYKRIKRPFITYGFEQGADYQAKDWQQKGIRNHFTVKRKTGSDLAIQLNLPGRHNVLNALATIIIAIELGVSDEAIIRGLANFAGVGRRFQSYGDIRFTGGKAHLIDDYGHHPREISTTVEAVRKAWPEKRLVLAFQPHRYSRTNDLFDDFVSVLSDVDVLVLLDIYEAGEQPIDGISSQTLAAAINKKTNINLINVPRDESLKSKLNDIIQDGDLLLTQGAGSIGRMAQELASK